MDEFQHREMHLQIMTEKMSITTDRPTLWAQISEEHQGMIRTYHTRYPTLLKRLLTELDSHHFHTDLPLGTAVKVWDVLCQVQHDRLLPFDYHAFCRLFSHSRSAPIPEEA
jgi:hypothetical protein